jgi:hypothetical protein
LPAQIDLLLRLLAWDPSRRLLPADALQHPALAAAPAAAAAAAAASPRAMLLTLCRALQPPPKVEGPLRGAPGSEAEEEQDEGEGGRGGRLRAAPLFARGLLFGGDEEED